ncbi:Nudix family hydrolase [Marinobacterium mangrovicola]|uniref:8-oxo-dGTP diphosphatase n=1 Tax=Marinobacterium mangrovicola TaxID=1476959 RepID=A0A4R1G5P8_9GAMM|nr:Nudix family hydrolase [Marinobacterium mangrovicola]TCK02984.1 8-oxo-dGTPase [Marinobacterium mangrovicola]
MRELSEQPEKRLIHVAAAVITDAADQILIAKRSSDKHQGGLWEFPGGKVEPGEPVQAALARELDEELGIQVKTARPLIRISHHYPDKSVLLDVWQVDGFAGKAHGREGQPVRWVSPAQLNDYEFPAANRPIVSAAQLPSRLWIAGSLGKETAESLKQRISSAIEGAELEPGAVQFMLRDPELDERSLGELFQQLKPWCEEQGLALILNASVELANELGAERLHLTSSRLNALETRKQFKGEWLSASCHDESELRRAAELGLDFTTLSPVQQTLSHPGAKTLGWPRFFDLTEKAVIPVYALGGVTGQDLPFAWEQGAQGIASISDWWPR